VHGNHKIWVINQNYETELSSDFYLKTSFVPEAKAHTFTQKQYCTGHSATLVSVHIAPCSQHQTQQSVQVSHPSCTNGGLSTSIFTSHAQQHMICCLHSSHLSYSQQQNAQVAHVGMHQLFNTYAVFSRQI
jgi:hypothetical protein